MQSVYSNTVITGCTTRRFVALEYRHPALAGVLPKMLDRHPGSLPLLRHMMEIFMEDAALNWLFHRKPLNASVNAAVE